MRLRLRSRADAQAVQAARQAVVGPQAQQVPGRPRVEDLAFVVRIRQVLGRVVGVAREQFQARRDLARGFGFEALAAHLAGGARAIPSVARETGLVVVDRAVLVQVLEHCQRNVQAPVRQFTLDAGLVVLAFHGLQHPAVDAARGLRFEHCGITGVQRPFRIQRIHDPDIGDEFSVGLAGRGVAAGVLVEEVVPADPAAADQGQGIGRLHAPRAVQALLLDLVAAARFDAAIRDGVDVLPRPVMVDVEYVPARGPGAREPVVGGEARDTRARHDFLFHSEQLETAQQRQVGAALAAGEIHAEVAIVQAAAVGVDRADRALVRRGVALVHRRAGQFQAPILIEAVLQIGKERRLFIVRAVPRRPGEGGAGQSDIAAVGVARQAHDHGPAPAVAIGHAEAHGGVGGQVVVQRRVQVARAVPDVIGVRMAAVFVEHDAAAQRAFGIQGTAGVQLQAIVIPGPDLAGHHHGRFVAGALAHQVDRAARAAGALQQAGGAAQNLRALVERHGLLLPVAQRVAVAQQGHAIVLQHVHRKAARVDGDAQPDPLHPHHAGGVVDRVGQRRHDLIVHALAGDHADRLRDVLHALGKLAYRQVGRRVAVGRRPGIVSRHGDRRQRDALAGAAQTPPALARRLGFQAGARQQAAQRFLAGHRPLHARRGDAVGQAGIRGHQQARLGAELAQRGAQGAGRHAEFALGGCRGLGKHGG
ncbi:hypothetical protein D9M72_287590 [compost metagenome]